jgi:hypothetical protein
MYDFLARRLTAPSIVQGAGIALTIADAAVRVREEHNISVRGKHLEFMEQGITVTGIRTAVYLHDEGILFSFPEIRRFQYPALDRVTAITREDEFLRSRQPS